MTSDASNGTRHLTLDAIRGVAVMGILLMNVIAFTMPEQAYINPLAWGGTRAIDLGAWAVNFVLVDGKMRGLFSLLFGASMLLVADRAEAKGEDGASIHYRRMFWLLLFGLAHYYLIWFGDILVLYAVVGCIAFLFRHRAPMNLIKWGIIFIALGFWQAYFRPRAKCEDGAYCARPQAALITQVTLWLAAALVLLAATIEWWAPLFY